MRIVTKILAIITIITILLTFSWSVIIINSNEDFLTKPFDLIKNENDRTLTVKDVYVGMNWEDIEISQGHANLPSGTVNVGDIITDCYGIIKLSLPGEYTYGDWNFSSRSIDLDTPILFSGVWQNSYQIIDLDYNGSYNNTYLNYNNESIFYLSSKGNYNIEKGKLIFGSISSALSDTSINYNFENNNNSLTLYNESTTFHFMRTINSVKNSSDIENFSYQKVNISGNLSVENESYGYLTLSEDETMVLISFNSYNESNISDFDKQNVEIIGYLYRECDIDFWNKACIKNIESINIFNE